MLNLNTSYAKYRKSPRPSTGSSSHRTGGKVAKNTASQEAHSAAASKSTQTVKKFNVLYRKFTTKKNKTWEGDGELVFNGSNNVAIIKNEDGVVIGRLKEADKSIYRGVFRCSGYEFELDEEIVSSKAPKMSLLHTPAPTPKYPKASTFKSPLLSQQQASGPPNNSSSTKEQDLPAANDQSPRQVEPKKLSLVSSLPKKNKGSHTLPLYDVSAITNPLYMPEMPKSIDESEVPRPVVVDPSLSSKLRPHQRDGVTFLYSCLMGLKSRDMRGAILADEMGLGKTLQTISLIWTLLRQSPIVGSKPVIEKVLICCPVSLVNNWKTEFSKWLGMNRINVLTINNNKYQDEKQDVELFGRNKVYQVMIIGYEKMQTMSDSLSKIRFDLLVCDEGHRLKSSGNKAMKTLESFNIRRKILLTGTPIQNDLTEFYTMANFTNPGILGDLKSFQKKFIKPILDSRDSSCTNNLLRKKGKQRSEELMRLTNSFILRRSNVELTKYLPKRSDYVILVPPTMLQLQLFKTVIETKRFKEFIADETSMSATSSFNLINTFRKICNSPSLLKSDGFFLEVCERNSSSADDIEFRNQLGKKVKSGKILALIKILGLLHARGDEKIVIVSNFTSTLDIIESIFKSLNLTFSRLDGSTPSNERGKIVDRFNKSDSTKVFAMLLSAKAGGVGLNLIGASRLVLFDNDWNPAVDLQAIARIHRDGQKREVKIYRLLTNGCMDEKIFQRQLVKQDLSDKFVDKKGGEQELFSRSDVKDIFTVQFDKIKKNEFCSTHELMCCDCNGSGSVVFNESDKEEDADDGAEFQEDMAKQTFISASEFSERYPSQENFSSLSKKKIRRCMKGYRHINAISTASKENLTDDSLLNTLMDKQDKEKPLVSYIFGKY